MKDISACLAANLKRRRKELHMTQLQLAEALDGVDSPVRTDVELTAEQSGNFTYGEEMVAGLKFVDWNIITENQAKWIEMWNSTFSVK